ncbi:hypothetical protein BGW80DRAFT_259105 [Lactifluus volemus]|nr:hypothetical protein BGW80DRAFT_259105 [Lactifluus volemus]
MKNIRYTGAHKGPFVPCLSSPYCQRPTMFVKHYNIFLILAVAIIGVFAQSQINLDQCTVDCLEAEAYDCYYETIDYNCFCNNYTYQSAVVGCLSAYCTYTDTDMFLQAMQDYCTYH